MICKQDLSQRVTPFVFINYGEKYYSCDGTRGEVPGSRFKQFAPGIVQAWGELLFFGITSYISNQSYDGN